MKNTFIAVLMLATSYCSAQVYVNQIDVNKFDYQYLEVWEHYNKQSEKFYAMIDYGQDAPRSSQGESYKVNEMNGEPKKFNSTISILNFLHKNGWEIVGIKKTGEISSYIMKRSPKMEMEEDKASDSAENDKSTENNDNAKNENEEKNED